MSPEPTAGLADAPDTKSPVALLLRDGGASADDERLVSILDFFGIPWVALTTAQAGDGDVSSVVAGLRDAFTLKYLHAAGESRTIDENVRTPWRRWFHHMTFYGFLLCFASTSVAAVYHNFFGWRAPYGFFSMPVVFGTLGGIGLIVGPIGLLVLKMRRDRRIVDPRQDGMDLAFIGLLLATAISGLALMVLRSTSAMSPLLAIHLAVVSALFVTLPFGKFVHGIYRSAALLRNALEKRNGDQGENRGER